ncbi:MAG TPA: glutamine amidotransferase [Candidatus Baltobacteraceae bacterium]|nr:glutamine amidotransferase [Candidatus Baltobacteraceae bacterium]
MFQFLFKYPAAIFSKGHFILLGTWPRWTLLLFLFAVVAGLGWLIRSRVEKAAQGLRNWRAAIIWLLQSAVAALILLLLWQPAITVAQLKPQQNIIAILVDDSRSMAIADNGATREAQALKALNGGVLSDLQKRFQTRVYSLDSRAARVSNLAALQPTAPATRIGDSLKQFVAETSDLPIGAVILFSDGSDNSGGIDLDTISALRNRRIPVHTVGLGAEEIPRDVEIDDAVLAPKALANSRLAVPVTFHQRGYAGQKATITVRDGDKLLASQPIEFAGDGKIQTQNVLFSAGDAGAKALQFSIDPQPDETNRANNAVTRLVNVVNDKRRILYVEGEPRWEYKFIRRAEDDDKVVQIASMLRTTENKIYRQGIDDPKELADGFPSKAEDLFGYQGLIIGSVEVGYFTPAQQDLIRQFVDRRGGGLLFLGGRFALSDGGWGGSSLADLLPTILPSGKNTFHRVPANVQLTPAGQDSLICRLVDDPARNAERWKTLPYLMDYQEPGTPKPGATVLAEMRAGGGHVMPLLVTQNFGRGRTALMATSGTWRWQMSLPLGDTSHTMFWQQLLRWLVADSPSQVVASVPNQMLFDDGHVKLSADVRDKQYLPAPDATVEAHVLGPGGLAATIEMTPVPDAPGTFQADWNAEKPGSYLTEVIAQRGGQEIGRDVLTFQRMDGVAENFHTEQNRDLLEKLAQQTGGNYWKPDELPKLPGEIAYSEAGITVRDTKPLWDMPAIFLLILALLFTEWLLRRKWGIV